MDILTALFFGLGVFGAFVVFQQRGVLRLAGLGIRAVVTFVLLFVLIVLFLVSWHNPGLFVAGFTLQWLLLNYMFLRKASRLFGGWGTFHKLLPLVPQLAFVVKPFDLSGTLVAILEVDSKWWPTEVAATTALAAATERYREELDLGYYGRPPQV